MDTRSSGYIARHDPEEMEKLIARDTTQPQVQSQETQVVKLSLEVRNAMDQTLIEFGWKKNDIAVMHGPWEKNWWYSEPTEQAEIIVGESGWLVWNADGSVQAEGESHRTLTNWLSNWNAGRS